MFYGVAQDNDGWWADNVDKFVAVTPCIIPDLPVSDYIVEPVIDGDGNPVIDQSTNEPMYDYIPVYITIEDWRASNAKIAQGMAYEEEDGSITDVPPIYNFFGPGWDEVSQYLIYYLGPVVSSWMLSLPPGVPP